MKRIGCVGFAAALMLGGGGALAASAEKGRKVYMAVGCWGCHGTVGQGGVTGPKIGPDPLPLDTFVSYIRTTNRAMPPYREPVLSNSDIVDIHAYLQSVPKPADYKSIPLLNQ
jgi:ubiquinol-cytochrome c reductase cytochrome c subunit